jgi:hypothetical protein
MIRQLTGKMYCGTNWERLPEPLNKRRQALDDVLRYIGLAGEQWILTTPLTDRDRTYYHLQAAQQYVMNARMHTPWMTAVVARVMLGDLMGRLEKAGRRVSRWWHGPWVLGLAGIYLVEWILPVKAGRNHP